MAAQLSDPISHHHLRVGRSIVNQPVDQPSVLVLLATYNGKRWLAEQCRTILNQTGVEVAIIASDDGSTDDSRDYLECLQADDKRLFVLPKLPPSGSAGKNFYRLIRDADISRFDYVSFSDQDDIWYPEKLSRAILKLQQTGMSGYSSAVVVVRLDGRKSKEGPSNRTTPVDYIFESAGQGCTYVFSRELFLKVQKVVCDDWDGVSRVHYHDWLAYALCRAWNFGWYFDQNPSLEYRQHGMNELGARGNWAAISRRWKMIKSGWYRGQVEAIAQIVAATGSPSGGDRSSLLASPSEPLPKRLRRAQRLGAVGRRRLRDRMVLAACVLLGYI